MDQRSKALVLLQHRGGTHTICQRARTLVTTRTRRECTGDINAHARSWNHTHDGHARTRDIDAHARSWEHTLGTHAHETSMQSTLVNTRTRWPRANASTHALVHAVVKGERCRYSMTATLEYVSIAQQATLCDGRMRYSHLYVVDTDNCREQRWWVSTDN